jgi:hypothetical protein
MAIKIIGTTVIDDSQNFKAIAGAVGEYGDFQPITANASSASGTVAIPMNAWNYINYTSVVGDITFSLSSLAAGRSLTIFVDSSSSGHDQGFTVTGGTVLYPGNEPDWTTARYWLHRITCWSSDTVTVVSQSWGS